MALLVPTGTVYQAGTLSGNPLATAAANATLDILEESNCYEQLEATSAMLEAGLADAAKGASVPLTINRVGSIMSCFFTEGKVRNFADVQSTNIKQFKRFFAKMLSHSIYLAPSTYEAMFVSLAHTKQDIKKTVQTAKNSFRRVKG
jgi:glutamate-1-semialdehyde 2,1-aminomutase